MHPVSTQPQFASALAALKCLQIETAAELDALLPAFLDRAFRGGL